MSASSSRSEKSSTPNNIMQTGKTINDTGNVSRPATTGEQKPAWKDSSLDIGFQNGTLHNGEVTTKEMKKGDHYNSVPVDDHIEHLDSVNGKAVTDKAEQEKKEEVGQIGLLELFRFADGLDIFLIIVGTISAIVAGCCFPVNLFVYSQVLQDFIEYTIELAMYQNSTSTSAPLRSCFARVNPDAMYFLALAGAAMIACTLELFCWTLAAQRQTHRIRSRFFSSVLRQHIGWFDANQAGQMTSRLAEDVFNIENGIGDKMGTLIQWMATFISGFTVGFVSGWKLTLIMLSLMPIMMVAAAVIGMMNRKLTVKELNSYAIAGAIAEEVLTAIKTVTAFGAQERETERYGNNLDGAKKVAIFKGLVTGIGLGVMFGVMFPAFGLAFWYGTTQTSDGFTGGDTMKVTMGVFMGSMALGYAAPNLQTLGIARGAAAKVYKIIDLVSEIDSGSEEGLKPETCSGNVQFENVAFTYPQRKEVKILNGVNFEANVGNTVALVGSSGCGKSTIISLIQRFYDAESGIIRIDGVDVKKLNVQWLREQIGIVSQEPVLFNDTIADNIRYGCREATQEMIEKAAKEANAHDFIMKLPDKYNTLVGERGTQLSGGQKQRIAIARGIIRNPKILLLDEATSALDSANEILVQNALDKARLGRTTIVIAHRLSTIRNANVILAMDKGVVVEKGTHSELLAKNGLYSSLHNAQAHNQEVERSKQAFIEDPDDIDPIETSKRPLSRASSTRSSIRSEHGLPETVGKLGQWTEKDEEEDAKKLPPASLKRIISMNKPEMAYIVIGCIAVFISGGLQPAFAIIFSGALSNFANLNRDDQLQQATLYAIYFTVIGLGTAFFTALQQYCLSVAGECLTLRFRHHAFQAMLYQEMAWFDEPRNQVGALTSRLATDAAAVKGASGTQLGTALNAISTMVCAVVLAMVFGWKLALVVLGFVPFLLLMGLAQRQMVVGLTVSSREVIEGGGRIASEAINSIRTVASLGLEKTFVGKYTSYFKNNSTSNRQLAISSLTFGVSQSVIYFVYIATFNFGAYLIDQGEMDFLNVLRVFSTVTFSAMSLGRAMGFAPDYQKARLAASKMFTLLDRQPLIDVRSKSGETLDSKATGAIEFHETCFTYPTRPGIKILRGLNLSVKPGQTVALVGQSGCGKSTTVQLLERFYDATGGIVKIDNYDVRSLQLQSARRIISLVSQEPLLFNMSIRDNIVYGLNKQDVPMDVIIDVARKANIHDFVSALPQGYDTLVGERATQLSGGQKQRIAIARALIRDPKILLLDEATSALDSESELIVQEALDKAREGRTSIVIAHRLSTIVSADLIVVIEEGKVVEQGTHNQLLAQRGRYYNMQQAQKAGKL